jgi:polysaccharide pyruvyl transferase WcaK-like protein
MVRFSRWLIDRGYDIVLLKSQTVADALVAEDLLRELHETAPAVDVGRIHNPSTSTRDELMAHIATCDLVVGVRFHCHVLPFVLGIPVVGIAYHDKSADLMDYMGQSEFSIPVSELSFDSLVDRFSALESKKDAIEDSIRRRSQVCRDLLYRHFDEIANAVVGKPVSKSN